MLIPDPHSRAHPLTSGLAKLCLPAATRRLHARTAACQNKHSTGKMSPKDGAVFYRTLRSHHGCSPFVNGSAALPGNCFNCVPSAKRGKASTKMPQQGHGWTSGFKGCVLRASHKCSKPQTEDDARASPHPGGRCQSVALSVYSPAGRTPQVFKQLSAQRSCPPSTDRWGRGSQAARGHA